MKRNAIIIGAAGRDFHNFNTFFRKNKDYRVVAFTAAQIPYIDGRVYPAVLAGKELYPEGIPIVLESELPVLIKEKNIHDCIFSYSDVPYPKLMHLSAVVNAAGANFVLLGPNETMLTSTKPVIAVVATRTGCGKSQTSRAVVENLIKRGLKVIVVRHPMPYGDLAAQAVQRFATVEDLKKHKCTVEEMEEYEPHVVRGNVIYAGVDYERILRRAEEDPDGCDVILWDGGNNDFSFFKPDLTITVADPHRAGAEVNYYPGEVNLRLADVVVINKMDTASPDGIRTVRENIAGANPTATVIDAASPVKADNPGLIRGKRCLIVEDGPTLTHGEMKIGAGTVAAQKYGCAEAVDPRPFVVGELANTFAAYPHIGAILPAMGYSDRQLKDLETTINRADCDTVVVGTPIDLNRLIHIQKPVVRVHYDLQELGTPTLKEVLDDFVKRYKLG